MKLELMVSDKFEENGFEKEEIMKDKEAYELIGQRVMELVSMPEIQAEMVKIANEKGKEAAEKMIYMTAIGTLIGLQK